jgi:hypothetical protein
MMTDGLLTGYLQRLTKRIVQLVYKGRYTMRWTLGLFSCALSEVALVRTPTSRASLPHFPSSLVYE